MKRYQCCLSIRKSFILNLLFVYNSNQSIFHQYSFLARCSVSPLTSFHCNRTAWVLLEVLQSVDLSIGKMVKKGQTPNSSLGLIQRLLECVYMWGRDLSFIFYMSSIYVYLYFLIRSYKCILIWEFKDSQ